MILYHGSICEIRHPDVSFSKSNLDFGCAFYLTSYRQQAEKWARRKAMRHQCQPVLNVYEFTDDWRRTVRLFFETQIHSGLTLCVHAVMESAFI